MSRKLVFIILCAMAFVGMTGCSWSLFESDGAGCALPEISFAGADHPFICMGEETTIRVEVTGTDVSLQYLVSAESGVISAVPDKENEWTYTNDSAEGETRFHVFVENTCGISAESFVVTNVACTDSDSDSEFPGAAYEGPRHVILLIGDGMGINSEIALSRYLHGEDRALRFHGFPYVNYMTTWDINTYNLFSYNVDGSLYDPDHVNPVMGYNPALGGAEVIRGVESIDDYFLTVQLNWPDPDNTASARLPATDSAAAATAMATGTKTDRYNLSWAPGDPPEGRLKTVAEYAREQEDMGIGVVSTVPFSHATPAAFVAHNTSRYDLTGIAHEILFSSVPDVVITGGNPIFYDNFKYVREEDWAALQTTDAWQFVQRQVGVNGGDAILAGAAAAVAAGKPLLGIFGLESFEHPVPQDTPGNPSFVPATNENPTLAQATEAALTVLSSHENGFFLMVEGGAIDLANHQHDYSRMVGCMWDFDLAVAAAVDWVNQDGDDVTMDNTLIIVTADHANGYITFDPNNPLGAGDLPQMVMDSGWKYPDGDVAYNVSGHTNEMVHIYAAGAGIYGGAQNLFAPYEGVQYAELPIIDNTHIFYATMNFLGLQPE
ncbi:MAG: alkaline phosphatase [Deltaproteobacteria bacterium]|nr:alkaline phosphatase [Deltaproteobacteria bacterium]MBN2671153.1 alkaline phosphatase [Deltaproteobacteria bacterium]